MRRKLALKGYKMALMKRDCCTYESIEAERNKRMMCAYYDPHRWCFVPERKYKNGDVVEQHMRRSMCAECCCDGNGQYTGEPVANKYCKRARIIRGAMPAPLNPQPKAE